MLVCVCFQVCCRAAGLLLTALQNIDFPHRKGGCALPEYRTPFPGSLFHLVTGEAATCSLCFRQGTGCNSAGAARLSVARAQRQLAEEAGVFLHIRNFSVRMPRPVVCVCVTLHDQWYPYRPGHKPSGRRFHRHEAGLRRVCSNAQRYVSLRSRIVRWDGGKIIIELTPYQQPCMSLSFQLCSLLAVATTGGIHLLRCAFPLSPTTH